MISRDEYKWLERHTDILCNVPNINDYTHADIKFKIHRPAHVQKIKDIFKDYHCVDGKNKNNIWVKVKGLTIDDFNDIAYAYNGDLIYDLAEHDINYIPSDKKRNYKIIRRSTPKLLANLSNRKKLDILFSFSQVLFPDSQSRQSNRDFISKNSDKFIALLQLKISADFMAEEYKKVQKITDRISALPNIKSKLDNFQLLPAKEQKELICQTALITAEVNGVNPPKIHFISNQRANNDPQVADWVQTDAFADYHDIYINKDYIKEYSGAEALTLAFHETTHIAQSNLDYKNFPEIEDMFSHHLSYLQNYAETYSSAPLEMITYNLEQNFCEQLDNKLNLQMKNHSYDDEYVTAGLYIQKALRRTY